MLPERVKDDSARVPGAEGERHLTFLECLASEGEMWGPGKHGETKAVTQSAHRFSHDCEQGHLDTAGVDREQQGEPSAPSALSREQTRAEARGGHAPVWRAQQPERGPGLGDSCCGGRTHCL